MKKKILSIILTLSMVLSLLPTGALAAEGGGHISGAKVFSENITPLSDDIAPTVETVTPTGADAATDGNVVITFSEVMNTTVGTVVLDNITLTGLWANGGTIYTASYTNLAIDTEYTLAISAFKDIGGNEMVSDSTNKFKTTVAVPGATLIVGGGAPTKSEYAASAVGLNLAISEAKDGETVQLGEDITMSGVLSTHNSQKKSITLDLGTHTLRFDTTIGNATAIHIQNKVTLRIKGKEEGKILSPFANGITVYEGCALELLSGTIETTCAPTAQDADVSKVVSIASDASFTMSGGKVYGNPGGALALVEDATATISGGEIIGRNSGCGAIYMDGFVSLTENGTANLTISGGKVWADPTAREGERDSLVVGEDPQDFIAKEKAIKIRRGTLNTAIDLTVTIVGHRPALTTPSLTLTPGVSKITIAAPTVQLGYTYYCKTSAVTDEPNKPQTYDRDIDDYLKIDKDVEIIGLTAGVVRFVQLIKVNAAGGIEGWAEASATPIVPSVEVTDYTSLKDALETTGNLQVNIKNKIEITGAIDIKTDKTINGGGFVLFATTTGTDDWGKTQAGSAYNIFTIEEGKTVTMNDVTIKGGSWTAVINAGTLHMNDVVITQSGSDGFYDADGGGLKNQDSGRVVLTNCAITRNVANKGGGIKNHGVMIMEGCSVTENRNLGSASGGGGIHNGDNDISGAPALYMNNCTVANNQSSEVDGGITNYKSKLYILNSTITGNVSKSGAAKANYGGGIGMNHGTIGVTAVVNSIITNNYAIGKDSDYVLSDIGNVLESEAKIYHSLVGKYVIGSDGQVGVPEINMYSHVNQEGAELNVFAGYRASPLLTNTGEPDTAKTFDRPVLIKQSNNTYAVPLKKNTETAYGKTGGSKVYFSYNIATTPVTAAIAYGETPAYLLGTSGAKQIVTYQGGTPRVDGVRGSTAVTDREYYTINMEQVSNCAVRGSHSFGDSYLKNTAIELEATPALGYAFIGWYAKGAAGSQNKLLSTDRVYKHSLGSNVIIVAVVSNVVPIVSAGSALRTSGSNAVVKFTTNQPGEYYYEVVSSGATSNVNTTGSGAPCGIGEQTINLTNLSAGAKDIYIVLKNAADKVNVAVKVEIPAYVATSGIEIDETAELVVSETKKLNSTFTSATPSNPMILWSSSDLSIATVKKDGTILGIRAGTATITAKAEDGGMSDICSVTVTEPAGSVAEVSNEKELATAINNSAIKTINIKNSFTVTKVSTITRTMTIDGGKHIISAAATGTDEWGKLRAGGNYNIFKVNSGTTATIDNMTIKGGGQTAVVNDGALRMKGVVITQSGSQNAAGGALLNGYGATVSLVDCAIARNVADFGGGFVNRGTVIMDGCSITENRNIGGVNRGGGGGENSGVLYLNNCTLSNNQSTEIGGGINNNSGTLYVLNSTITGNVSNAGEARLNYGGGIGNNRGHVSIINSIIVNNFASSSTTAFARSDIGEFSGDAVVIENSIVQAVLGENPVVKAVNDDIFAEYRAGKLLDANGAEIGTEMFLRPLLSEQVNGTYAAPLVTGSTLSDGCDTYFAYNDADSHVSSIAYAATPVYVIGYANYIKVEKYQGGAQRDAGLPGSTGKATAVPMYTLKVEQGEHCTVTGGSAFGESYKEGSQVVLKATVASGYLFEGWYSAVGDTPIASAAEYTHTMLAADATIVARAKVNTNSKPVTGVTLNRVTLALQTGNISELIATIAPGDATDFEVEWKSSNEAVATVADTTQEHRQLVTANVTALAAGTTTITVKTHDGDFEATCDVTVTSPPSGGDDDTNNYIIKASAGQFGTISPNGSTSIREHGNKTYTIKANEGYEIANVLVDGVSVGKVKTYTFEKVSKNHTIEAKFVKAWSNPYDDVTIDDDFYDGVRYVTESGLMKGTGNNKFSSKGNISRGMMVTVLYRMEKEPEASIVALFADTSETAYYADALNWSIENNVAKGYGDSRFGPEDSINREQALTMLWREMGSPMLADYQGLTQFTDVASISSWAQQAMAWAHQKGYVKGTNGKLAPQEIISRGETAEILSLIAK